MTTRMAAPVLRTGEMKLSAWGQDVVLVERFIEGGRDVFGCPAEDDRRVLAVNRCGEQRRIDFGGRVVELPPESAVWLTAKEEKKSKDIWKA